MSGDVNVSAVAQHAVDEGHEIDWSSAIVIDGHPNFHRRCALEAWHIRSQDTLMNRDAGPLPQVYNPLIHHQFSSTLLEDFDIFDTPPSLLLPYT